MSKKFLSLLSVVLLPLIAAASPAEDEVKQKISEPGLSVVHLWAPWCGNCKSELKSGGWTKIVQENPQVHFYFVSVWDSGDDGRALLAANKIANQPNVTILADPGPRGVGHITQFAGEKFSWIPTTWIFQGGDLRYALNYGEIHFPVLQQCIADCSSSW